MSLFHRLLLFVYCVLPSLASAEVVHIDSQTLNTLVAEQISVVDIRTADEWQQTGIVPGSHQMTFFESNGNYDADAWLSTLATVAGSDQPVVLICHSGSRSALVANWLSEGVGYARVYNVNRGIVDWLHRGNQSSPADSSAKTLTE